MAEIKTDQEPSIEEILESIRQIISEDSIACGSGGSRGKAKPAAPQPAPVAKPVAKPAAPARRPPSRPNPFSTSLKRWRP